MAEPLPDLLPVFIITVDCARQYIKEDRQRVTLDTLLHFSASLPADQGIKITEAIRDLLTAAKPGCIAVISLRGGMALDALGKDQELPLKMSQCPIASGAGDHGQ